VGLSLYAPRSPRRRSALAERALGENHARAAGPGDVRRGVGRAVVGNPHLRARKSAAKRGQSRPDSAGLVAGRDDDQDLAGSRRSVARAIVSEVTQVEAHITGTVWKIECAVGDAIEEGDTVAILESMKMEMPVEAEDSGTVAEIRCEEGQAVNEGDVLVVLD
jgi:acetyl-CoA carboxylase biotin carboxyl carrier protein